MNKELKEKAHKEFDERFHKLRGLRPHLDFVELQSFIDSLIDKTVAYEQERIVGIIKKHRQDTRNTMLDCEDRRFLFREIISLITHAENKSDINKDKE